MSLFGGTEQEKKLGGQEQQLDRWREGDPFSARHLNQPVDAIKQQRLRLPRQVRRKIGGEGTGVKVVKIGKAIAVVEDATDEPEQEQFQKLLDRFGSGAHLRCVPVDENWAVSDPLAYIVAHPVFPHTVQYFKDTGFTSADPDDPVFWLMTSPRGNTLFFGQGEIWVIPPAVGDLCT